MRRGFRPGLAGIDGILLPLYFWLGSVSAYTRLHLVSPTEIASAPGWVYFIGHDRKTLWRMRTDGDSKQLVMAIFDRVDPIWSRVSIERTSNNDRARLLLRSNEENVELLRRVGNAGQAPLVVERMPDGLSMLGNTTFGPGSTKRFVNSGPRVYCGFWALEGLHVGDDWLALDSPLLSFMWRSPVVLPDGKIVAQLGEAIVLLDPKSHKIAELEVGTGPDVLLDRSVH